MVEDADNQGKLLWGHRQAWFPAERLAEVCSAH